MYDAADGLENKTIQMFDHKLIHLILAKLIQLILAKLIHQKNIRYSTKKCFANIPSNLHTSKEFLHEHSIYMSDAMI